MRTWSIVFDPASGKRVFRSLAARARSRALPALRWCVEIAGVVLLALAAWTISAPLALAIIGGYAVIAANIGQDE
jgi:hypothetical protein